MQERQIMEEGVSDDEDDEGRCKKERQMMRAMDEGASDEKERQMTRMKGRQMMRGARWARLKKRSASALSPSTCSGVPRS